MFLLPKLKYGLGDLNKSISEDVMGYHYLKHHQTYTDKLNLAIDTFPDLKGRTIEDLLINLNTLPEQARQSIRNMGGGYYNHNFFWESMSPDGGGSPMEKVLSMMINKYGSFESFKDVFSQKAISLFGSGWVWLTSDGEILPTNNQDNPMSDGYKNLLLCIDVWEHAYYLDYKNKRDEYVKSWWNVVDWAAVEKRYEECTA